MSNLSLKWRPKCFAEVVGQPTVVSILSRQIATKSFKNVYLFCGAHGCGKTTVARILASEINNGLGEPIELDAASNNGIDNIRALILDSQQLPIDCDYKVYIIDECHQLTKAAWDAALKLIEEPPLNSIFIFCTTNPDKLPQTILSRVQRFDFKRVDVYTIAGRLAYILNEETDCTFTTEALYRIAAISNGHIRDAINMLDKCVSYSNDVTLNNVELVLGIPRIECIHKMVANIINNNLNEAINIYNSIKLECEDSIQIYDNIIDVVINHNIYVKTGSLRSTNIPESFKSFIINDYNKLKLFLNRLMKFRTFANQSNADNLLKTIFIEITSEE
jgi:DNA polymerase-3 subunit gamma/tau